MLTINFTLKQLSGHPRIFAHFNYHPPLISIVKQLPGARWSSDHKSWHFPPVKEIMKMLSEKTKGIAELNIDELRRQLEERKSLPAIQQEYTNKPDIAQLSEANRLSFEKYIQTLILKAYSNSTIKTYRNEFFQLLKEIKNKPVDDLNIEDIRRYIYYCFKKYEISEATANSRINAIKFYYEQVLGKERMFVELPRPKKPLILPKVLGENELARLFNAVPNLKHKAILFTAYSAGLRVSEVIALQLNHVDSDRMQLYIKSAKGKKDRYVGLSPLLLDVLRVYVKSSKIKPLKYVFESVEPGIAYSAASAEKIFNNAKHKAGIKKEILFMDCATVLPRIYWRKE